MGLTPPFPPFERCSKKLRIWCREVPLTLLLGFFDDDLPHVISNINSNSKTIDWMFGWKQVTSESDIQNHKIAISNIYQQVGLDCLTFVFSNVSSNWVWNLKRLKHNFKHSPGWIVWLFSTLSVYCHKCLQIVWHPKALNCNFNISPGSRDCFTTVYCHKCVLKI